MISRLIGHGIDMGLIQPLPPTPTTHTGGNSADSDFNGTQCLSLKKTPKTLPSDKCH